MNRLCIFLALLTMQFFFTYKSSMAQVARDSVKVKNWGGRAFILLPGYWDNKSSSIIDQIGVEEFEKVKKYSDRENIPPQLLVFFNGTRKDTATFYKKLSLLKVQRIATYKHVNGRQDDTDEYAIIRVPYKGNETWDNQAKWDTVYFIVPNKDVVKM